MNKDLFAYLNATVSIQTQLLDTSGVPIDLNAKSVYFKTAKEFATLEIESYSIGNGVSIIDSANGIIAVQLNLSTVKGYSAKQFVYQISTVNASDEMSVHQDGRLFINPTIEGN